MAASDVLVSKSEFARLRGVSAAMVTKWRKAGRLAMDGNQIKAAESMALLGKVQDPARGGKNGKTRDIPEAGGEPAATIVRPPADPGRPSFDQVRTAREAFNAKGAELDYRERVGQLVEKDRYDKAIVDALAPILSSLDSLSARLGPGLAAESDPRKVQNMIDAEMANIRRELADTLRRMITGAAGTRQ